MLVSDLILVMGLRGWAGSTVEVDFLGHSCVCVGKNLGGVAVYETSRVVEEDRQAIYSSVSKE
jgi:hypothetical protein